MSARMVAGQRDRGMKSAAAATVNLDQTARPGGRSMNALRHWVGASAIPARANKRDSGNLAHGSPSHSFQWGFRKRASHTCGGPSLRQLGPADNNPGCAMSHALDQMAAVVNLDRPGNERLRLEFGYACASRVAHLLEDSNVSECLSGLGRFLEGSIDRQALNVLADQASILATQHQGSKSIDGCGHAAVSATYAVANALNGKARQAAEYAAYAMVYGQGGYGAVAEKESFEPEYQFQATCLEALAKAARAS